MWKRVDSRDDRTHTKIRRNFRFRPVLPGFGFVRPFFAQFCLKMPVFCPFLRGFAQFRPFRPVRLVLSKFTRIRSVLFVPCLPGFGHHWWIVDSIYYCYINLKSSTMIGGGIKPLSIKCGWKYFLFVFKKKLPW